MQCFDRPLISQHVYLTSAILSSSLWFASSVSHLLVESSYCKYFTFFYSFLLPVTLFQQIPQSPLFILRSPVVIVLQDKQILFFCNTSQRGTIVSFIYLYLGCHPQVLLCLEKMTAARLMKYGPLFGLVPHFIQHQ